MVRKDLSIQEYLQINVSCAFVILFPFLCVCRIICFMVPGGPSPFFTTFHNRQEVCAVFSWEKPSGGLGLALGLCGEGQR